MSYRHTLEAAIEGLHEIEELLTRFSTQENIAAIEMDLTLQKMRNLYELFLMMKEKEDILDVPLQVKLHEQEQVIKNMQPKEPEVIEKTEVKTSVEVKEVVIHNTDASDEVSQTIMTSTVKKQKTERQSKTLADQFLSKPTLHEALHQNNHRDEQFLVQNKPIDDLASAIGINDRFTFIHELFGNDKNLYDSALITLNQSPNFNDAYNFMIHNFDWDMNSEPVQLLLDIVRRKFIKGRHE
jgi:hypothetical protein